MTYINKYLIEANNLNDVKKLERLLKEDNISSEDRLIIKDEIQTIK